MYNQQLQRSFNRINDIKTSKTELIERHWLQNNTYNIIFVATVLFLSSLFCWSGRSETFYCDYDDTPHYIREQKKILKNIRVQVCDRCDAKRLLYNFIMKCFEFSNWLYACAMCVPCVCLGLHAYGLLSCFYKIDVVLYFKPNTNRRTINVCCLVVLVWVWIYKFKVNIFVFIVYVLCCVLVYYLESAFDYCTHSGMKFLPTKTKKNLFRYYNIYVAIY